MESKIGCNEPIYKTNRFKELENRLVVVKEEGGWRGMDWEFGVGRGYVYNKILM